MTTQQTEAPRRRDADSTRAAILFAARRLFARRPYSDITIKAIAEMAGVSAPLVIKYFGSKEQLFARIASFEDGVDELLDAPLERLGRHMVWFIADCWVHRRGDPIVRITFSLSHAEQTDVLRANFKAQVVDRLARRLAGPDAGLRAELVVAQLLGLSVVMAVVQGDAVTSRSADAIADVYGPGVQALLTGVHVREPVEGRERAREEQVRMPQVPGTPGAAT